MNFDILNLIYSSYFYEFLFFIQEEINFIYKYLFF